MMITTHILLGALLGGITQSFLPIGGAIVVGAAGAGFPDLDMFFEHRKTFHRPFEFIIIAVILGGLSFLNSYLIVPAIFFLSSAPHCFSDILCNGKTMRPMRQKDDRAVFNHIKGEWIHPKRFFYDGSRIDAVLAIFLCSIVVVHLNAPVFATAMALASIGYHISRTWITSQLSEYERFSDFFRNLVER